jgi:HAD superfamily hydrolase (TIGR01509 family)
MAHELAVMLPRGDRLEGYRAVLFDMDGVIIDTHQAITAFWLDLAGVHGVNLTGADFTQHVYGCPAEHTLDRLFPHLDAGERQAVLADMEEYETNQVYIAMDGAAALLRALKQHDIPTVLVTSGAWFKVNAVMGQLGIDGLFSAYVTADDIRHGKPHPECYLLAAQSLQQPPERCIVFEDAVTGVQAAVASGALCVGIRPPGGESALLEAGARHVIAGLASASLRREGNAGVVLDLGESGPG